MIKTSKWIFHPSFLRSYETQYVHAYNQSTTVKHNNVFVFFLLFLAFFSSSRKEKWKGKKKKSEMLLNSALLIIVCIKFTRQPPPHPQTPFLPFSLQNSWMLWDMTWEKIHHSDAPSSTWKISLNSCLSFDSLLTNLS